MPADLNALLGQAKPVAQDEARALIARAQAGDQRARQTVIQANLRLVFGRARKITTDSHLLEDLVSEGAIGLATAIDKFDLARVDEKTGRPLAISTYAQWWIDHAIRRALQDRHAGLVRVPVHLQEVALGFASRAAKAASEDQAARAPAAAIAMRRSGYASLDAPIAGLDGDSATFADLLPCQATRPDEAVIEGRTRQQVRAVVERFLAESCKPRNAEVLRARLLCYDGDDETLSGIGARLGLSRERVRQIEVLELGRLRDYLLRAGIDEEDIPTGMHGEADDEKGDEPMGQATKTYTWNGKTQPLRAWAKETALPETLLFYRHRAGWSAQRALTTPAGKGQKGAAAVRKPSAVPPPAPEARPVITVDLALNGKEITPALGKVDRVLVLVRELDELEAAVIEKTRERDAKRRELEEMVR